jgi:NIMA (never in mitosis gene a)-related kinase 1/4/5
MEQYDVRQQLGKGGMGTAFLVTRKNQPSFRLALKCVWCQDEREGNDALREAKILQSLQHPHIVRYEDVFLHNDNGTMQVCTIMEYCKSGDLARHLGEVELSGNGPMPERTVRSWLVQLAEALAHIHRMRVLHRDLAVEIFDQPGGASRCPYHH